MDHKTNTIKALSELGHFLSQFTTKSIEKDESVLFNDLFFDGFKHQIKLSEEHNGWFSEKNILFASGKLGKTTDYRKTNQLDY